MTASIVGNYSVELNLGPIRSQFPGRSETLEVVFIRQCAVESNGERKDKLKAQAVRGKPERGSHESTHKEPTNELRA